MITWNETVERFAQVTDKLGKKIDDGIFETVVALNMLGISTRMSCEGHMEGGVSYPWIDIHPDLEQKHLLYQYLCQFYKSRERTINFDCILSFHGYRIRPQGAAFSSLLDEREQKQKLIAYQAEMVAFTSFIKSLLPPEKTI